MAVAAGEAQASISKKVSLGGGTYRYYGTFALGSAYATGGYTLGTAPGERYSLPERIDMVELGGGLSGKIIAGKLALYGGAASGVIGAEITNATNLSAQTSIPFAIDGC